MRARYNAIMQTIRLSKSVFRHFIFLFISHFRPLINSFYYYISFFCRRVHLDCITCCVCLVSAFTKTYWNELMVVARKGTKNLHVEPVIHHYVFKFCVSGFSHNVSERSHKMCQSKKRKNSKKKISSFHLFGVPHFIKRNKASASFAYYSGYHIKILFNSHRNFSQRQNSNSS